VVVAPKAVLHETAAMRAQRREMVEVVRTTVKYSTCGRLAVGGVAGLGIGLRSMSLSQRNRRRATGGYGNPGIAIINYGPTAPLI
jgi:hypothetical protein